MDKANQPGPLVHLNRSLWCLYINRHHYYSAQILIYTVSQTVEGWVT